MHAFVSDTHSCTVPVAGTQVERTVTGGNCYGQQKALLQCDNMISTIFKLGQEDHARRLSKLIDLIAGCRKKPYIRRTKKSKL